MTRVYAEDTSVPVSQSKNEIDKMLRALDAYSIAVMENPESTIIVFEIGESMYKIERPPLPDIPKASVAQRERAAWRALVLVVKSRKVMIDQGITTVEREFFADTVMPGGTTLIEHREDIMEHNYQDGPPRLTFSQ